MKRIIALIALTFVVCNSLHAQILRPFTARYSNTSVRGNIVYVANNIITSSGGTTTEAAPAGTSTNNGRTAVNIDVDASLPATNYISWGASWKYLDDNTRPAGWETSAYDDAAWLSGNAELGYGDGDEVTTVGFGGVASNKYVTTLFRKTVTIANPSSHLNFLMDIEYDDGFVVYVNGVEVGRGNMPTGAVTNATFASAAIEDQITTVTIPSTSFVSGVNTIAVEIHQANASSSDLSFNLKLDGSNDETFNSSTANLSLTSCSQILWAGLYWGASQGTDGSNTTWMTGANTVKFKAPGASSYTTVTASQVDYHNSILVPGLPHSGFRSFADITSLINTTNANGTYTVANVTSPAGYTNTSGGWTIVIVYSNPSEVTRNLTVFDGSAIMDGGNPALDVPISGFLTPPSGPVSCELGAIVFDGDRTSQDEFSFRQGSSGAFTNLTPNTNSNLNDMWNSTISYKGNNVTTRNPAHQNTLGYDADILLIPNSSNSVLGNNQTAATVRFSSPSENYFVQVLTTSISVFNPSFSMNKTSTDVNGGLLNPGDVLRYQIDYNNVGNDASIATQIVDNIPSNTIYKPGSLMIDGVAKTDAIGDDEAEYDYVNNRVVFRLGTGANGSSGGEVSSGSTGTIRCEVYTPTSCAVIACNNVVINSARAEYNGKTSLQGLYDSSGYYVAGCYTLGSNSITISGTCVSRGDTILLNTCPSTAVTIPAALYGGFEFYSAMPFNPGNAFNPFTTITSTRTIYAFYDGPGTCDDTILIRVYINPCPDIDYDNDGIPDYVEANNPLAFGDHDSDGTLNYADPQYPGYVDNNSDGINDNFDPGADSDNDGIPNFLDSSFPGFIDANSDGVNDAFDKDRDGIPNQLDLDSDNDGIPDVVESFGVDNNGDGRIDNYTDTDADGLSQNVDANNTGIPGSGNGLTALDTDGDGVPNYLDLDSDNDGITDVVEVYGTDANNNGRIDSYADTDGDGYSDNVDGDVGNDGTAENSTSALLRTSTDGNNDGRCDNFPNKNMDGDTKPNPYDLDSDGDGIVDVLEAQFNDVNQDGRIDGSFNADGWSTTASASGSLSLPNRDGTGRANVYDIDSDDDGIPDNVEGMSTASYQLPSGSDSDADGIDNTYDDYVGFGGKGISINNQDGDAYPDYIDNDTDGDGLIDRIEGNDFNFNKMPDDNVTLTGLDTDDDGLDDRFDNNNSSPKGTSAYMGNGGTLSGDVSPGSITVVQRSVPAQTERDWRIVEYVLNCDFINLKASLLNDITTLRWSVICQQQVSDFIIERSVDGILFIPVKTIGGTNSLNEIRNFITSDNISQLAGSKIYYRIKAIGLNGRNKYSNTVFVVKNGKQNSIEVFPNPVKQNMQVMLYSSSAENVELLIYTNAGALIWKASEKLSKGSNALSISATSQWPNGAYLLQIIRAGKIDTIKFSIDH